VAGTARAHAWVTTDCTGVDLICRIKVAKGIDRVRRIATGNYCVRLPGLDAYDADGEATVVVMTGVDYNSTAGPETGADVTTDSFEFIAVCQDDELHVHTQRLTDFSTDADADDVGFWIAIP
jgi:hypothetical protein